MQDFSTEMMLDSITSTIERLIVRNEFSSLPCEGFPHRNYSIVRNTVPGENLNDFPTVNEDCYFGYEKTFPCNTDTNTDGICGAIFRDYFYSIQKRCGRDIARYCKKYHHANNVCLSSRLPYYFGPVGLEEGHVFYSKHELPAEFSKRQDIDDAIDEIRKNTTAILSRGYFDSEGERITVFSVLNAPFVLKLRNIIPHFIYDDEKETLTIKIDTEYTLHKVRAVVFQVV